MKELTKTKIFLFWDTQFFRKKEKRTLRVPMEMKTNGGKGKHWQLKGSLLSLPMRLNTHPSQNLCRIGSKYEMLKYGSEWPNQAAPLWFPGLRGHRSNSRKKKRFRKMLLQLSKHCGALFKNWIYETLLPNQSSISGTLLSRYSYWLILKVKLMDWSVKSSPKQPRTHSQCLLPAPGKCLMTAGWATRGRDAAFAHQIQVDQIH